MVTSNQIIKVIESYFKSRKFGNRFVEIYVNPPKSEMLKLTSESSKKSSTREIRFVINPEKKQIYVCDGYIGLHPDMRRMLDLTEDDLYIIYGNAFWNGQDFIVSVKDCASEVYRLQRPMELQKFLSFDWSWVDKYVKGLDGYLRKFKK